MPRPGWQAGRLGGRAHGPSDLQDHVAVEVVGRRWGTGVSTKLGRSMLPAFLRRKLTLLMARQQMSSARHVP